MFVEVTGEDVREQKQAVGVGGGAVLNLLLALN